MGRRPKKSLNKWASSSKISAALVDLLAVLADQFALAPFESRRAAIVARRGGRRVVALLVTRARLWSSEGRRFCFWAHASNHVLRRPTHKGFLCRLTLPGPPRHISTRDPQPGDFMTSSQIQKDSTQLGKHGHDGGFDLHAAARRILVANGFEPEYDAEARNQLDALTTPASAPAGVRDLRDRPWSSIDNKESKDLDQIEIAEAMDNGCIRVIVGVADVDSLVPKGSPLD